MLFINIKGVIFAYINLKKIKVMWAKIEVYNYGKFIGSFYEHNDYLRSKHAIVDAINKQYGAGNWDKYNLEY